jgi:hypothetical protein
MPALPASATAKIPHSTVAYHAAVRRSLKLAAAAGAVQMMVEGDRAIGSARLAATLKKERGRYRWKRRRPTRSVRTGA